MPKTLKELRARQKRLPADECLAISLALARALAHLHVHGLVHRDIKPSNVIFVHGVPKLADIGLVSAIDTSHSFVGTEGFVPPEGPGSAASDVFSLGKVIYEISSGQDRNNFPKLPEDLDSLADKRALLELNEVLLKACDPDLQRRYDTAEAMREDLLLLQAGKSVRRLHVMERRFAIVVKYGAAATFIAALAIGGFLWASAQIRQTRKNLQRAERAEADADGQARKASESQQQSRRLLYASDMNLAQQALKLNNLGKARRLLDRHWPQSGEEDLRGWEWRYLWQLTRSSALVTLTNRPTSGVAVSFSPNGSRLAVGWWDGRVELWDVLGRRFIRALTEGEQPHQGRVALSPVRNLLAATSESKVVTLFDLDFGRKSILWRAPGEGAWSVRDLAFSQDGSRVVIYAGIPYQITRSTREVGDEVCVVNVSSSQIESRQATVYSGTPFHGAARLSADNRRLYLARSDVLSYRYSKMYYYPAVRSLALVVAVPRPTSRVGRSQAQFPPVPLPELGSSTNVLGWLGTNILCHWNGTNQILVRELGRGAEFIQRGTLALESGMRPTGLAYNSTRQLLAWTEGSSATSVYVASLATPGRRIELKIDIGSLVLFRFSEDGNYLVATAEHNHSLRA